MKTVLVAGATGATGKFVVQQLLDKGHKVRVVARSKERMMNLLNDNAGGDRLSVTEASLLDLPESKLQELTNGCDAVVSCLGHNMSFRGMYGKPRQLVKQAVERLTAAMPTDAKFILMGSNGVANPNGQDPLRSTLEKVVFVLLRNLLPPHYDNELAAAYLHEHRDKEWVVVRPGDLIDNTEVTEYDLHKLPPSGPFDGGAVSRANVADFMVRLILNDSLWKEWKFEMPVILNKAETKESESAEEKESETNSK